MRPLRNRHSGKQVVARRMCRPAFPCSLLGVLIIIIISSSSLVSESVTAFSVRTSSKMASAPSTSSTPSTDHLFRTKKPLFSGLFDDGDNNERGSSETMDFSNFNPLMKSNGGRTSGGNSSSSGGYDQIISLRKTLMQEMTGQLLNSVGDPQAIQGILQEYQDFLLEPLEDQEAVLEPGAIYTPNMSRAERYRAYRTSMDERLEVSKNAQAKQVLQSMRDFVLSFENQAEA